MAVFNKLFSATLLSSGAVIPDEIVDKFRHKSNSSCIFMENFGLLTKFILEIISDPSPWAYRIVMSRRDHKMSTDLPSRLSAHDIRGKTVGGIAVLMWFLWYDEAGTQRQTSKDHSPKTLLFGIVKYTSEQSPLLYRHPFECIKGSLCFSIIENFHSLREINWLPTMYTLKLPGNLRCC